MIERIIRIVAASTVSSGVAYIFIKGGIMAHVPMLERLWGVPMALAVAYIMYANLKIWNEKEHSSVPSGSKNFL